jgi:hypothetical protein
MPISSEKLPAMSKFDEISTVPPLQFLRKTALLWENLPIMSKSYDTNKIKKTMGIWCGTDSAFPLKSPGNRTPKDAERVSAYFGAMRPELLI